MGRAVWLLGCVGLLVACDIKATGSGPSCSITAPEEGGLITEGASIKFEGTAEGDGSLSFALSSDLDGDLGEVGYADGAWGMSTIGLSVGTHQISLTVDDSDGGTCEAQVGLTVGNPPTVFITSPAVNATVGNATPVSFTATIEDDVDAPDAVSLSWEHDGAGVFGESPADSDGAATAQLDGLQAGEHTVTLTATDASGFSASNTISFFVNDAPSTPDVQIVPGKPTSSDGLTAEIIAGGVDPDGDAVTHRYAWLLNGEDSGYFAPTVPREATARGDVWTLQVFARDSVVEGAPGEAEVTIANSPPTAPLVAISPEGPTDEDELVCTIVKPSIDEDGDTINQSISWSLDGTSYTGATETTTLPGDTIPAEIPVDGEVWQCTVEVDDGVDAITPVSSDEVTISPSIIVYDIDRSMLDNLNSDCSTAGNAPYNGCAGSWGFTWTSTGARVPSSMTITMLVGVWCSSNSPSIELNGTVIDTISPGTDCNCSPGTQTTTIKTTSLSSYNEGGSNSISVTGGNSCEGLVDDGSLGSGLYASIEVDY